MSAWRNAAIGGLLLLMGAAASPVSDFQRGLDLINARDYRGAVSAYDTDIANRPNSGPSYHNRGLAYYRLGELAKAESDFRRATSINPTYNGWLQLGRVLKDQKNFEEAITVFNRSAALDSTKAEPVIGIGEVQLAQGKNADALATFQKASGIAPTNLIALDGQADALILLNRLPEARTALDKALAQAPADYSTLISRGALEYNSKQFAAAAPFYLRATQASPNNAVAHQYLADAYSNSNRYAEAKPSYERSLALEPRRVDSLAGLTGTLFNLGDVAGARAQLALLRAVDATRAGTLERAMFPSAAPTASTASPPPPTPPSGTATRPAATPAPPAARPILTALQAMECPPAEPGDLGRLFTSVGDDSDDDYDVIEYALGAHRPYGLTPTGIFEDMEDYFFEERIFTLMFNQPYATVKTAVLNRFGMSRCDSESTSGQTCGLVPKTTGPAAQQHGRIDIAASGQRTRVECSYLI